MRTVLKFPVYVIIDSDNVDRNRLTVAASKILKPSLYEFLSDAKYSKRIWSNFKEQAGVENASISIMTEEMLIKNLKDQNSVNHL